MRRIGGGYGSKISRQHIVSTATAVAARKVQQPVRVVVDLNTNMTYAGWRDPYYSTYEVCLHLFVHVYKHRFYVHVMLKTKLNKDLQNGTMYYSITFNARYDDSYLIDLSLRFTGRLLVYMNTNIYHLKEKISEKG